MLPTFLRLSEAHRASARRSRIREAPLAARAAYVDPENPVHLPEIDLGRATAFRRRGFFGRPDYLGWRSTEWGVFPRSSAPGAVVLGQWKDGRDVLGDMQTGQVFVSAKPRQILGMTYEEAKWRGHPFFHIPSATWGVRNYSNDPL